jgi:hypothetical protein
MQYSKEYRIARLNFFQDLLQDITDLEPQLLDLTDWTTNTDAVAQMIKLIDSGEV